MNTNIDISSEIKGILAHPFISNLNKGVYDESALRLFAEQYYLLSHAFIDFLLLGSIRIKTDEDRSVFIENLFDEHGGRDIDKNHRKLFRKFLYATGYKNENKIQPLVTTSAYINGMNDLCSNGTELEILGALGPGCEGFSVAQYELILSGIKNNFNFNEDELIFFTSHISHDPRHDSDIEDIITRLAKTDDDLQQVLLGAKKSILFENIFWDGIYNECEKIKNN